MIASRECWAVSARIALPDEHKTGLEESARRGGLHSALDKESVVFQAYWLTPEHPNADEKPFDARKLAHLSQDRNTLAIFLTIEPGTRQTCSPCDLLPAGSAEQHGFRLEWFGDASQPIATLAEAARVSSTAFEIVGTWVHPNATLSFEPDGRFLLEQASGNVERGTYRISDRLPRPSKLLEPHPSPTGLYLVLEYDRGDENVLNVPEIYLISGFSETELWLLPANRVRPTGEMPGPPELLRRVQNFPQAGGGAA